MADHCCLDPRGLLVIWSQQSCSRNSLMRLLALRQASRYARRTRTSPLASCLPTSLQASSKLLGLDCFFRQPSTDFFARTFFQLLNRCKLVQDCSDDGINLAGKSICCALWGGEQQGVQQRGSERIKFHRFQLPIKHDSRLPLVAVTCSCIGMISKCTLLTDTISNMRLWKLTPGSLCRYSVS